MIEKARTLLRLELDDGGNRPKDFLAESLRLVVACHNG